MATTKQQGQKAQNVADVPAGLPDKVRISWVQLPMTKFAGDKKLREYNDPIDKTRMVLVDPNTGQEKPFTMLGNKTMDLKPSDNKWHEAVYKFIFGKTVMMDGKPVGRWRGHPSFAPTKRVFSIEDITAIAKSRNLTRKQVRKLQTDIESMTQEQLLQFGLLFGIDGKNEDYDFVLNKLEEIIETPADTPEAFFTVDDIKKRLESADRQFETLLAVLLNEQVITKDDVTYKYDGRSIGVEEGQVIQWLKDNPLLFQTLKEKFLKADDVAAN